MTYSLKNKIRISIVSFNALNKTLCQLLRFLFKFENINLPPDTLYKINLEAKKARWKRMRVHARILQEVSEEFDQFLEWE